MSTSTQVEAAWEENIWLSPTVQAMTENYFLYDVSDDSAFKLAQLYHENNGQLPIINFFLCLVQRRQDPNQVAGGGAGSRYQYQVRVEYYLQQTDVASDTYRTLRDRLETVDDLVRTALGGKWDGTVDYWEGGVPLPITSVTIDGKTCWKGGASYTAIKTT